MGRGGFPRPVSFAMRMSFEFGWQGKGWGGAARRSFGWGVCGMERWRASAFLARNPQRRRMKLSGVLLE